MKTTIKIMFAVFLVWVVARCKGNQNKSFKQTETTTVSGHDTTKSNVYSSLTSFALPLSSDMLFLQALESSEPIGETVYHSLTDIGEMKSSYNESARAVRLPEQDGRRYILAGHLENEDRVIDLYSLSGQLEPKDRLRVYGVEHLASSKTVITQTFTISEDYHIIVSKTLNGTLIERLTYMPTTEGIFKELRDGKTTTVAFDSYDGVNYIVQTFVWEYNSSGGLVKKDLRTENYRITENGSLVKTTPHADQSHRQ